MDQDIFNPPRCPRAPLKRGIMECKLSWKDGKRLHVAPPHLIHAEPLQDTTRAVNVKKVPGNEAVLLAHT